MFVPKEYAEDDLQVQQQLIKEYPLGTVVTLDSDGNLNANHIPFVVKSSPDSSDPGQFQLIAHFHKKNPLLQDLQLASDKNKEIMIVFKGPDRYSTPSWYPSKKTNGGKTVPTWLYSAVHVYGVPRLSNNAQDSQKHDELQSILETQSIEFETSQTSKQPSEIWHLSETPVSHVSLLKKMIVGVTISVTRTQGKWKLNQAQRKEDVEGTASGLKSEVSERGCLAAKMADEVAEFHEKYCQKKKF